MTITTMGPATIANMVSILRLPSDNAREHAERGFVPISAGISSRPCAVAADPAGFPSYRFSEFAVSVDEVVAKLE